MFRLRHHLRRFAAFLLWVWLFAAGAALAQACPPSDDQVHHACCTEAVATDTAPVRTDALPAQPGPGDPASAPAPAARLCVPQWRAAEAVPASPGAAHPPHIPIVFLRLAL